MYDFQKVCSIAQHEADIHYQEGISASGHWNNDQKYSKQLPGFAWSNLQAWCDTFVAWVFFTAGILSAIGAAASASVFVSYSAWLRIGRFTEYPTLGAQIIYGKDKHTGICIGWDSKYVYASEGNTNTNGSAEGDGVYVKQRLRSDPYVTGYGIPLYPDGVIVSADPKWNNYKTLFTKIMWGDIKDDRPAASIPEDDEMANSEDILQALQNLSVKIDTLLDPKPDYQIKSNGELWKFASETVNTVRAIRDKLGITGNFGPNK